MRVLICSLALFLSVPGFSQIVLKGEVVDTGSSPILFASVLLLQPADTSLLIATLTDSMGAFHFNNLDPGTYFVSARFPSCVPFFSKVTLKKDTAILIRMGMDLRQLLGVTITSSTALIEKKPDRIIFNISNSPFAIGSTAWEVLKKSPGLRTDETGTIMIKGMEQASLYINNRKVSLNGAELVDYLKGINAEDILKIEIITHPPASYEAEGNGGVINIQLKTQFNGFNGTASAGAEQTFYMHANAGVSLKYGTDKTKLYVSLGSRIDQSHPTETQQLAYSSQNKITSYAENGYSLDKERNTTIKTGADYILSPQQQLGILLDASLIQKSNVLNNTGTYSSATGADSSILTRSDSQTRSWILSLGLYDKINLDSNGKSLSVETGYLQYHLPWLSSLVSSQFYDRNNFPLIRPGTLTDFNTNTWEDIKGYTAKADYTQPLSQKGHLDAGLKISETYTNNLLLFETGNDHHILLPDTGRSNHFTYRESNLDVYTSYAATRNNLDLQTGLRAEGTLEAGADKNANVFQKEYARLFPSLFLQYNYSDAIKYGFVYNRRISRPPFHALTPFQNYISPFSYSLGNPFLQPSYTDELDASIAFKDILFADLFCNLTQNNFVMIYIPDSISHSNYYTYVNIQKTYEYGISLTYSKTFFQVWTMNASASGLINGDQSSLFGKEYSLRGPVMHLSTNQNVTVSSTGHLQMELNIVYSTPGTIQGILQLGSYLDVSLGIKKQLPTKRLSVALLLNDLFSSTYISARSDFLQQKSFVTGNYDQRGLRISLSYKLGRTVIPEKEIPPNWDSEGRERIK